LNYRVCKDLCEEIKKDDEVEIVPEYGYMMGTSERIKDKFKVGPGEVVVMKLIKYEEKDNYVFIKCNRKDIKPIKN
jgi:uncharacterized protein (DUF4213/DUF364 family)